MKFYRKATVIVGMLALVMLMVCSLANTALATDLSISTTSINADAIIDVDYSQTIIDAGGTEPYTFSWAASENSSLPPGLVIDESTGEISGTPTNAGSYTFKVTVSDSDISGTPLEATQEYTLTVHDPIPEFTPGPQKICVNDPISIDIGLPNGVSTSGTLYAVVKQVNTGTGTIDTDLGAAPLSDPGTDGICNVSWSGRYLGSGDYMILVFDGQPMEGSWPIACGYFAVIIPQVEVTKEVWSDYSSYFWLDLSEYNDDNLDVWSGSDSISLRIYKLKESGGTVTKTLAGKVNNNINISDDGISFPLPSGLTAGDYEIDIFNNSVVIATADFTINLQYLQINPEKIFSDYGNNTKIVLYKPDGNEGIWYARETDLGIQIVNKDDNSTQNFNLSSSAVGGGSITFVLPAGLEPAPYKINLLKAAKVIASCGFTIEVHAVNITPRPLRTDTTSFELTENDADLWSAVDSNISLELYYGTPETNGSNIVSSSLYSISSITDSAISVSLPNGLPAEEYALFIRKGGTYIGGVRFGVFRATAPAIIGFNGETSLIEGYEGPVAGTLTEPAGSDTLWSSSDELSVVLYKQKSDTTFAPTNLEQITGNFNPTIGESVVSFTIPQGLSRGRYLLALMSGTNTVAYAVFLVKPDPIQLQVNPQEICIEYASDMMMGLYPYNETPSWSINDSLEATLLQSNGSEWSDISDDYPVEDIYIKEDCIYLSIPEGLPMGSYRYIIKSMLGQIAYGNFKVNPVYLNSSPYEFEADGNAASIKLYKEGALWTGEGNFTYSILKWVNDVQENIGINNQSVQLVDGSLTVTFPALAASSLPDNSLDGGYVFIIYKDGQEYAHANIKLLPSVRRLDGAKVHIPSSADAVTVPIYGYHLEDVAGIEFRMYYNPDVVSFEQIDNTACIPNTTLNYNVNTAESYADITIIPQVAGTVFGTYSGPVCKIGFYAEGNENSAMDLKLEPISTDNGSIPIFVDANGNGLNEWNISYGYIDIRRCGDINFNDNVDIGDAVMILRHDAGLTTIDDSKINIANVNGDVDEDGNPVVDSIDAILILQRIVNLIPCFPIEQNIN